MKTTPPLSITLYQCKTMTLDLSKISALANAATTPPVPPVENPVEPLGTVKAEEAGKTFRVELEGEPPLIVEGCIDRLHAQEKYMKALGIIRTERKFTYTEQ